MLINDQDQKKRIKEWQRWRNKKKNKSEEDGFKMFNEKKIQIINVKINKSDEKQKKMIKRELNEKNKKMKE